MTVASVLVESAILDEPTGPEYRLEVLEGEVGITSVFVSPREIDGSRADDGPLGAV